MRGFLHLTWIEAKLFLREWQTVFFTFLFMPMLLFLFGSIYRNDPSSMFGGFGSVDYWMVPGYIAIGIASNAFFTIGGLMANYRERGILRRFRVTPLRPGGVLIAQVLVAYGMTLLSALLLMALARIFFGLRVAGDPLSMWAGFTLAALSIFSLGFMIGSLFGTARASYAVNMTVFFPMMFLSGAAIPLEIMPPFMQNLARLIPLTYVVNLLRDVWLGYGFRQSWPNIAFLIALFVVSAFVSAKSFRWE